MSYAIDMKLRHIQNSSGDMRVAKIYSCKETGEFVVRFFEAGVYLGEGPSLYTEDYAEAINACAKFTWNQGGIE